MEDSRKRIIMEAVFKAMLNQLITRFLVPTGQGSLSGEIEQLSTDCGIPLEELMEFLKEHLDQAAIVVLECEAPHLLQ